MDHLLVIGHTLVAENVDDDDGKHQRCKSVQCKVALQQSLDERSVFIDDGGILHRSQRIENSCHKNHTDGKQQHRRHKFSDNIHHLGRLEGKEIGDSKEYSRIKQHRNKMGAAFRQKRNHTNLKGNGSGARKRKKRTQQQVDDCCKQYAYLSASLPDQAVHVASCHDHRQDT